MRVKLQDFCMSDAMPFQQHHECRTEYPLEKVVNSKDFLLPVKMNLRVGDRVAICQYDKVDKEQSQGLVGVAYVRIADLSNNEVTILLEYSAKVGDQRPGEVEIDKFALKDEPRLKVKRQFGGGYGVYEGEACLDQFKTKSEAEDWANRAMEGSA